MQDKIFNKFYQIDRQAGAGYNGSGLGLAICHGIMALHGGTISVESKHGKGSKFTFVIPRTDPSLILQKHFESLKKRLDLRPARFALVKASLDISESDIKQLEPLAAKMITEILENCRDLTTENGSFVIKSGNFGLIFVIENPQETLITMLERKIQKIIANWQKKNYLATPILPMLGVAVYPDDSSDIEEIESVVAARMEKIS